MLKVYSKINHKIFEVQDLLKFLVEEVFCKADRKKCATRINTNAMLKKLYENKESDWFKVHIDEIYLNCRNLDKQERDLLRDVFERNNEIEYLCNNPSNRKFLKLNNTHLEKILIEFFKELYDRLLKWVDIKNEYGTKKEYYDKLVWENKFNSCPCCGFGNIKTVYDKGHSAFDHYLPVKHYPLSVINFNNLFPLCTDCNSGAKSSKDILVKEKKIFYPFSVLHPDITFVVNINKKSLSKFFKRGTFKDRIDKKDLGLSVKCDNAYQEQLQSWIDIYEISRRYFGQVATNAISWLDDVREKQRKTQKTFLECFDEIISDDSNKPLGFLKSPYLTELKNHTSLIEAYEETRNSSVIRT